jgi:lipopolysaccharide heptosyltransferase II
VIPFLARIPRRAGYDRTREGAGFFINELADVKGKNLHAVEENLAVVVKAFGLKEPDPKTLSLQLSVPEEKERSVDALLRENALEPGKFVLLNPNSRWASKKWGMEKFEDLAIKFLASTDFSIALIGTQGERQSGESLARLDKRVVNLAGRTDIFELYVLMKRARLLVTNDSGPMHLASAAGLKTVAVFGPTSPERTGPFWQSLVVRADADCSPCLKKKCPLSGDRNMRCMTEVTVEEVFREALRLIL